MDGPGRTLERVEKFIQDGLKPAKHLAVLLQLFLNAFQDSVHPSSAQHRHMFHVSAMFGKPCLSG
jgi:hypothetical protein